MPVAVLGPMVLAGRQDIQLRDRTVLGVLLVRDGVVPVEAIADALWGDRTPASARKVVQGSVVRLRRLLGPSSIATVGDGYRLDIADAEVDARLLEALVARACAGLADGYGERAAGILAEALALWRGDAWCRSPTGPTPWPSRPTARCLPPV